MDPLILKPSGVVFNEAEHRYFLDGKELYGITSTLVNRAFPDTYKDIPEEVLRKAAERGTNIHHLIQFCEKNGFPSDAQEYLSYQAIKAEHNLTYVTHEYIVTDGVRYASPIDLVFVDEEGKIILADIKTTYKPHYENVALQLSIYKRFFELQNPGLKVDRCALIWLRDDKSEYKEMALWTDEALDLLIAADENDSKFDIQATYGSLPEVLSKVEDEIAQLELMVKIAQERQKALKQGLYERMEQANCKSFEGKRIRLTRVLPTKGKTFDTKRFEAEHPDLYAEYVKVTERAGSLKITLL